MFMFSLITLAINTFETFKYNDGIVVQLFNHIINFKRYTDTEILALFFSNLIIFIPTNPAYEIIFVQGITGLAKLEEKDLEELTRIIRLSNIRTILGNSKMSNKSLRDYKEALRSLEAEIKDIVKNKEVLK